MNQTKYVNKKHNVTVEVFSSEFFETHALVKRDGKLESNGIVTPSMIKRMIKELELVKA